MTVLMLLFRLYCWSTAQRPGDEAYVIRRLGGWRNDHR